MSLFRFAGKLLRGDRGLATDANCCCGGGDCCGRSLPGGGGLEWPSTLTATITPNNCPCFPSSVEIELTWNAIDGVWEGSENVDCPGGAGGDFSVRVTCGDLPDQPWVCSIDWGTVCVDTGGNSSITFDMTGTCDPLSVSGTATGGGIGCCAIFGGWSLDVEVTF